MKVLLIGDGNSQHIINYTQNLKNSAENISISILSTIRLKFSNKKYYDKAIDIFSKYKIYILIDKLIILTWDGFFRWLRYYFYRQLISKLGNYDIIHFHYISPDAYYLSNIFKKKKNDVKIIFSFWGSDFYRLKQANINRMVAACDNANVISFGTKKMLNDFISKTRWGKGNLKIANIGSDMIGKISKFYKSRIHFRNNLGISINDIVITIGTNLTKEQQHIAIIEQFKNIKNKQNIIIHLMATYPSNVNVYKNRIIKELDKTGIKYKIVDSYLTEDEIAILRVVSDVLINLPTTDAFSRTMLESLFARNIVITGKWLPYDDLYNNNAILLTIEKISELPHILNNVIDNYEYYFNKTERNVPILEKILSWEQNIQSWLELYN